jgi:hypothetical protein
VLSEEGRGNRLAHDVLGQLEPGQVAASPVEWDHQFILLQRSELHAAEPRAEPLFELPAPEGPDLAYFIAAMESESAARWLGSIAQDFCATSEGMSLSPESRQQLLQLHHAAFHRAGATPEARVAEFQALLEGLKPILGPTAFERYTTFMEQSLETRLLAGATKP